MIQSRPLRAAALAICATAMLSTMASAAELTPKIAWYGTVKSGLAEAARTNKPILFVSAAPHCLGVPGEW